MKHRRDIEELICYLCDKELTDDNYCYNRPEALTHLQFENAFASLKAAGIKHIEEVCPDKD